MNRIPTIALLFALFVPMACNGRNSAAGAPDAEATSASASASAQVADSSPPASAAASVAPPPPVHHRGLVGLFFRAAQDADLTDDEKAAVDKLEEPLRNDPGPRHEIGAFHSDLVLSIKAGKIDTAKIVADEAAVNKAYSSREEDQATAFSALHDALSSEQRKTVVDAIRVMQAAHDHSPSVGDGGISDAVAHRLERMKTQLALEPEQQRQVAAVLSRGGGITPSVVQARIDAGKKQLESLLVAFDKDTLDTKKLDLSPFAGRKASDSMERQVKYIGQLLPILEPEQRDRLAAMVEHPHMEHGRGGGDSIAEPIEPGEGHAAWR
jgi:Spy/CpxP family protein refolding chaperone